MPKYTAEIYDLLLKQDVVAEILERVKQEAQSLIAVMVNTQLSEYELGRMQGQFYGLGRFEAITKELMHEAQKQSEESESDSLNATRTPSL